ncbi:MAG: phosphatidate cytidylyltransferase [Azoarcus sp.]|jgi:phosphatidate cytidylyltransferase|nr:phosphatidate cytidylyltransferase [Azoarcus sp.]
MLRTRIITAVALLAGLLAALFFLPPLLWATFCALICALAAWEWGGLAGWGRKARVGYGIALGCLCLVGCLRFVPGLFHGSSGFSQQALPGALSLLFLFAGLFWLLIVPFWLWRKWPLRNWSAALTGVIVLVPPMLIFIGLRLAQGPLMLLAVCALVWVADIAAYFSGRTFGGKKLAPGISPGKTWAGVIGAVVGVLVYGNVILFTWGSGKIFGFEIQNILLLQFIFIGLGAVSIIGDLFESLLKRQAGVKDSSNLLPGHGGILDRVDSLTSTLALIGFMNLVSLFLFS